MIKSVVAYSIYNTIGFNLSGGFVRLYRYEIN